MILPKGFSYKTLQPLPIYFFRFLFKLCFFMVYSGATFKMVVGSSACVSRPPQVVRESESLARHRSRFVRLSAILNLALVDFVFQNSLNFEDVSQRMED